jgi:hypothetical protein
MRRSNTHIYARSFHCLENVPDSHLCSIKDRQGLAQVMLLPLRKKLRFTTREAVCTVQGTASQLPTLQWTVTISCLPG